MAVSKIFAETASSIENARQAQESLKNSVNAPQSKLATIISRVFASHKSPFTDVNLGSDTGSHDHWVEEGQ